MRLALHFRPSGVAVAATAALGAVLAAAVPALAISVTVDGQPATFSPPPIERAGRVFVPLRGVFERLGASVVYQGGVINATAGSRSVSLQIGSQTATVSGQQQQLDVAPFIVGASTYVPLRFVSQALGATVNYDAANQIVALNTSGGGNGAPPPGGPPPAGPAAHVVRDLQPGRDAHVGSRRPTIEASFAAPVDPNSVRIVVDGLDVSQYSTRSTSGFVYAPPSPLQSMRHRVEVSGNLADGTPFQGRWSFTSGSRESDNRLSIDQPADGASVGGDFVVSGRTVPGALVHISAGATANVGGGFSFGTGAYVGDTKADPDGRFRARVVLRTVPGASIGLDVLSTDPQSREAAEKKLHLRAQ
jgi:hypothetical protein